MIRAILVLAAITLTITGCANSTRTTRTILPSGAPGYSIYCDSREPMDDCEVAAGDRCPLGYSVLDKSIWSGWAAVAKSGIAGRTYRRTMLVQCKGDTAVADIFARMAALKRTNDSLRTLLQPKPATQPMQ